MKRLAASRPILSEDPSVRLRPRLSCRRCTIQVFELASCLRLTCGGKKLDVVPETLYYRKILVEMWAGQTQFGTDGYLLQEVSCLEISGSSKAFGYLHTDLLSKARFVRFRSSDTRKNQSFSACATHNTAGLTLCGIGRMHMDPGKRALASVDRGSSGSHRLAVVQFGSAYQSLCVAMIASVYSVPERRDTRTRRERTFLSFIKYLLSIRRSASRP